VSALIGDASEADVLLAISPKGRVDGAADHDPYRTEQSTRAHYLTLVR